MNKIFLSVIIIALLILPILSQNEGIQEEILKYSLNAQYENKEQLQSGESNLIVLDPRQSGKCLDGSPPAFYFRQGQAADKFVIYFEGGGWCGSIFTIDMTLQDCLDRSKTYLGTSKNLTKTVKFGGLLDNNPLITTFWNYSTIFIHYCDGSGHQGYNEQPFQYAGEKIYFRGESNTKEILAYASKNLGLKKASQVIVSGGSAGGLATFTWVDYINDYVKKQSPNAKVYAIPDAGFFLDFEHTQLKFHAYQKIIQNFITLTSLETLPPNYNCVKESQGEIWKCLLAEHSMYYIKTPVFIVQSPYDFWGINNILGIYCVTQQNLSLKSCNAQELDSITQFRDGYISLIDLYTSTRQDWGAWVPACVYHGFTGAANTYNGKNYEIPQHSSITLNYAITQWLQGKKAVYIDTKPWPANTPCSYSQN